MIYLFALISPITWLMYLTLIVPLELLAWVIVPPLAYFGQYHIRASRVNSKNIVAWNNEYVNMIYGNEEDGILNGRQYHDWGSDWKQIVYWSVLRNPTNNVRFLPVLSFILDPKKVRYVGSFGDNVNAYDKPTAQWFFAWHGFYSGFFWQGFIRGKLKRFWIGWKIFPSDINGVTPYRKFGVGFGLQFKDVK